MKVNLDNKVCRFSIVVDGDSCYDGCFKVMDTIKTVKTVHTRVDTLLPTRENIDETLKIS